MAIDKSWNGWDVTKGRRLWLERYQRPLAEALRAGRRIGESALQHLNTAFPLCDFGSTDDLPENTIRPLIYSAEMTVIAF
jgi:hypothetical protein